MKDTLEAIQRLAHAGLAEIEQTPEREHIAKLIEACERLDEYYKDWCEEIDDEYGDERGTAYEQGTNMEFYIESSEWHNISEALRELRKDEK
jgi:DNA gyrase/topoisomerase IV subunit A